MFVVTTNSSFTSSFYTIDKYLSKELTDRKLSKPLNNAVSGADPYAVKYLCRPIDSQNLAGPQYLQNIGSRTLLGTPIHRCLSPCLKYCRSMHTAGPPHWQTLNHGWKAVGVY